LSRLVLFIPCSFCLRFASSRRFLDPVHFAPSHAILRSMDQGLSLRSGAINKEVEPFGGK
jgi:hypothetical protein